VLTSIPSSSCGPRWKIVSAEVNVDFNDRPGALLSTAGRSGSASSSSLMSAHPMYRQSGSMDRIGFAVSPAAASTPSSKDGRPRCTVRVHPACPWIIDQLHVAERCVTECVQALDSWKPCEDRTLALLARILGVAVRKISTAIACVRVLDPQLFCERRTLPLITSSSHPEVGGHVRVCVCVFEYAGGGSVRFPVLPPPPAALCVLRSLCTSRSISLLLIHQGLSLVYRVWLCNSVTT
jgi:hypothetical protein